MTPLDVRARLAAALRLDLIGPEPDDPQISEVLPIAPSRWYLAGFLVPWNAPVNQKEDKDDAQGDLGFAEAGGPADDDETSPEPRAARRSYFPSSMGLSVLVPASVKELRVTVRWGDYKAVEKDGRTTGDWQRTERTAQVVVGLRTGITGPPDPVPGSDGLEIVTSVREVRNVDALPGLPAGVRAASVFLVNRRKPIDRVDEFRGDVLKDEAFAFQTQLTIEADQPFVPRPNPRGHEEHDADASAIASDDEDRARRQGTSAARGDRADWIYEVRSGSA